jgi:hypothetical protein
MHKRRRSRRRYRDFERTALWLGYPLAFFRIMIILAIAMVPILMALWALGLY